MLNFNNTTENSEWLCLQTGVRYELELTRRLAALDTPVPAYCPKYEQPLGDRGAWLTLPLFRSYLFCEREAYEASLHCLKSFPIHLRQRVVGSIFTSTLAGIQAREDEYGLIPVRGIPRRNRRGGFAKGDYVEIATGVLSGMKGYLSRDPSERLAWLHVQMSGAEVVVEVRNLRPALCSA